MSHVMKVLLFLGLCLVQNATGQENTATKGCPLGNTAQDIAALSGLNLEGKVALVTGGRSGLGRRIAEALLARNCTVVIASRHEVRNQLAVEDMAHSYPGANISYMTFDLEDFSSVRSFADDFLEGHSRLDYYFGNAGQSEEIPSGDMTVDGFERMFQVNYVAQFLLVQLLLPLLRETPSSSRIILTASSTHATACGNLDLGKQDEDGNQFCFDETIDTSAFAYLPLDQERFESVPASAWGCGYGPYSVSKYLVIQLGKELAKREAENGVYAYSFAPGPINTGLLPGTFDCCFVNQGYGWPQPQCRWDLPWVGPTDAAGNPNPPAYAVPNFWVSPEHGTMSPLFAALHADESDSGSFISTYYECEIEAGYIPQGITSTGQTMIYDQSMAWAGLLDEDSPFDEEASGTKANKSSANDEASVTVAIESSMDSGSSRAILGVSAWMVGSVVVLFAAM